METSCSKYHGLLAVVCLSECLGRLAGCWVFGLLTCRRALSSSAPSSKKTKKQNGSDVTKRLSILSSRPASSPQNPPDWFYRVWTTHGSKSTSLLLAQRKQALHTNATSSASVWSSWKEGTCRLRRIEQQVLLSDSAGIQKNTHTHTHTTLQVSQTHTLTSILLQTQTLLLSLFSTVCISLSVI